MPKQFFDYVPSKTRIWWGKKCSLSIGCDQVMSRNILRFWLDENFAGAKTEAELVLYHNHGIREIPSVREIVAKNGMWTKRGATASGGSKVSALVGWWILFMQVL